MMQFRTSKCDDHGDQPHDIVATRRITTCEPACDTGTRHAVPTTAPSPSQLSQRQTNHTVKGDCVTDSGSAVCAGTRSTSGVPLTGRVPCVHGLSVRVAAAQVGAPLLHIRHCDTPVARAGGAALAVVGTFRHCGGHGV